MGVNTYAKKVDASGKLIQNDFSFEIVSYSLLQKRHFNVYATFMISVNILNTKIKEIEY